MLKTFSEHNQQAPLHTDSQYRSTPERFIALIALHQAQCGGGYTELVDFQTILQNLNRTQFGRSVIYFFSQNRFPIAVPSIFQEPLKPKYINSKIISEQPLIRYRYDTLKAGLSLFNLSEYQVSFYSQKLDLLDSLIQTSPYRIRFLLSSNDLLILDDHRFLHGRSSFTDPNRLLLRCKMN
ncbi:MAG: TauD/TfdA family dioxygenase [Cyanobacteriota bacterium]|nr:TauD/TfdA family dioxygenase [Cyanobacteriota bacterium]